jgi:hypothetical protein
MSDDTVGGADERDPGERLALARRIDRFVRGLERAKRPPNRREGFHILQALRCLRDGAPAAGLAAIADAERVAPLPADAAALPETNHPVMAAQLREALDAIMSGRA